MGTCNICKEETNGYVFDNGKKVFLCFEHYKGGEFLSYVTPFEKYNHHGIDVWVQTSLKGKHRKHSLCHSCIKFNPGVPKENCPIANLTYAVCIAHHVTLPMWECPEFEEK